MALHVFNTLTRQKEAFVPADPKVVRIYTCGLTVYSAMHIGHARTYCFWDLFRRYLEYRSYHVLSVINYTDIDDRIMQRVDEKTGWQDLAESVIATFRRDCRALRIKDYASYTRATDFIQAQVDSIAKLIDAGKAYVVDGEVFYDVRSFEKYGQLSGNTLEGQQVGASGRVGEDAQRKRHPADFTLWKPTSEGQPTWQTGHSEWPDGRPGWHIECSAMSTAMLGEHFDVHGGGIDNLFPHHENEIAQSEPLCGHPWVKYWMHPEHLDLSGEKMSKSLGNVIGIPDLLDGNSYDEVRWFFSSNHYRTKLAFSADLLKSSSAGYDKIRKLVDVLEAKLLECSDEQLNIPVASTYASLRSGDESVPRERQSFVYGAYGEATEKFIQRFITALDDDLNTPQASAAMFDWVRELYAAGIEQSDDVASVLAVYRCLTRHLYVFGVERANERLYPELAVECFAEGSSDTELEPYKAVIDKMLEARKQARVDKDFAKADLIRDLLKESGVTVEDTPQGPRWWV